MAVPVTSGLVPLSGVSDSFGVSVFFVGFFHAATSGLDPQEGL